MFGASGAMAVSAGITLTYCLGVSLKIVAVSSARSVMDGCSNMTKVLIIIYNILKSLIISDKSSRVARCELINKRRVHG
jgi:hypothetical protein